MSAEASRALHRLRARYPQWDIRYHPAACVPEEGVFVACRVPAPDTTLGLLAVAATDERDMCRRLAIQDRLARRMADVAPARHRTEFTDPEDAVIRIQRQHPRWRIRCEGDPGGGRFVATRSLTAEQAALGLLETVTADNAMELAHRLAYQDALTAGAEAIVQGIDIDPEDLAEDAADLVAGCEELLRRAAGNL